MNVASPMPGLVSNRHGFEDIENYINGILKNPNNKNYCLILCLSGVSKIESHHVQNKCEQFIDTIDSKLL